MRIIVNDYSGHPFQVELSRALAARGHAVLHLYSSDFQTPKGDLQRNAEDAPTFEVAGLSIGEPFQKYNFFRRRGQEIAYAKLVCREIGTFKPDLVVGCNNPLDAQRRIQEFCRRRTVSFVFWLQDIYSSAIRCILSKTMPFVGHAIGAWYQGLERSLLRRSDHVVAISEDFLPQLAAWRVEGRQVSVIENWAPKSAAEALERDNPWSREHGLSDKKVALYTGTIGLKHNPDLLLDAADALKSDRDAKLVVVSEGKYAEYVKRRAAQKGLDNVAVLPFEPFSRYSQALASSEVLVAMIEPDAAAYSAPSKVLSYLRAGKPIVLAASAENLAAKTVRRANAGRVVSPCDRAGFVAAIGELLADDSQRAIFGASGKRYADARFDIGAIADEFEDVFRAAVAERRLRRRRGLGGWFAEPDDREDFEALGIRRKPIAQAANAGSGGACEAIARPGEAAG